MVSAARPGAGRAGRTAGRRRRPVARALAGRLPARHLPLVFGRPAGVVVVAQSPRGARARRIQMFAQPRENAQESRLRSDLRPGLCRRRASPARRAARIPPGTWITPEMHAAYCRLHERGHAHSVEVRLDGALVGGLYGVLLGRVFFGESMFSRERDASKVALARLVEAGTRCGPPTNRLPAADPASAFARQQTPEPRGIQRAGRRAATQGPDVPLFSTGLKLAHHPGFSGRIRRLRGLPQATDVERRCDSDGRRSRRDFA